MNYKSEFVIFFILINIVSSQESQNKTSVNLTNNDNSSSSNTSNTAINVKLNPPIMLTRTLIPITNNCKENPFLFFLPYDLGNPINETLLDEPAENTVLEFCQLSSKTCCTKYTIEIVTTDLKINVIPSKQKIFLKNWKKYSNILSEHHRNLINFFGFTEEQYLSLFSDYTNYVNNVTQLLQEIVKESLYYKWNSFCNLVCHPKNNDYCHVYNVTYLYNETVFNDLNLECSLGNAERVNYIKNLTGQYVSHLREIHKTIDNFYSEIKIKLPEVLKSNPNTNDMLSDNITFPLLNNSLNDGSAVSHNTFKQMNCEQSSYSYTNRFVANYSSLYNVTCENILEHICLPFNCLDNSFIQFNDYSVEDQTHILMETNYTKVILNKLTSNPISYNSYDKEIANLIEDNISFVNSGKFFSFFSKPNLISVIVLFIFIV